jgi:hypothetical protein
MFHRLHWVPKADQCSQIMKELRRTLRKSLINALVSTAMYSTSKPLHPPAHLLRMADMTLNMIHSTLRCPAPREQTTRILNVCSITPP